MAPFDKGARECILSLRPGNRRPSGIRTWPGPAMAGSANSLRTKHESCFLSWTPRPVDSPMPTYLDKLNPDQRRAAEHGHGPLLVIAGAGSGKTNTLAHRVAHLIVGGADPRKILLMTFSRRAAAEMAKRVERIVGNALGAKGHIATAALSWSGTFHGIGARLLREFAGEVGLDPAFTIHDREDSADLMNLVRHELGFSRTGDALSDQGHLPRHLFAHGQRGGGARPGAHAQFSLVRRLAGGAARRSSGAMSRRSRGRTSSTMTTSSSTGPGCSANRCSPARSARRFDHVLVDEYQDTNRLQASIIQALKPDGQGVTVVGDDAQSIYSFRAATVRNILDFPGGFSPAAAVVTLARNYRSTVADPRRLERGHRARGRALHQGPLVGARRRRAAAPRHGPRRSRPGALRRRGGARGTARPARR